jgi:hypothetical protein
MNDWCAGSVGMPVNSEETVDRDTARRSLTTKTEEEVVQPEEGSPRRGRYKHQHPHLPISYLYLIRSNKHYNIATLARQNKKLKAKLIKLKTAKRTKTKAMITKMMSKSNNL